MVLKLLSLATIFSLLAYYTLSTVSLRILDVRIILINFSYAYGIIFPLQGLSEVSNFLSMIGFISQGAKNIGGMYAIGFLQFLIIGIPSIVISWKLLVVWTHLGYGIKKSVTAICIILSSGVSLYFNLEVYKYLT